MNGLSNFKGRLDRVSEFFLKVSGLICLLLPVIILVVVVIRAVIPAGIPLWSIDICELLMWFLTYLSLGFVFRLGRHITVDVFIKNLGPRWRRINDVAIVVILLVMAAIMMAGGFEVSWGAWMIQKKTTNEFPEYFLSLVIPLGLTFFVYEVAVSLWKKLFCKDSAPSSVGH